MRLHLPMDEDSGGVHSSLAATAQKYMKHGSSTELQEPKHDSLQAQKPQPASLRRDKPFPQLLLELPHFLRALRILDRFSDAVFLLGSHEPAGRAWDECLR